VGFISRCAERVGEYFLKLSSKVKARLKWTLQARRGWGRQQLLPGPNSPSQGLGALCEFPGAQAILNLCQSQEMHIV
jgi:hypothetical protein